MAIRTSLRPVQQLKQMVEIRQNKLVAISDAAAHTFGTDDGECASQLDHDYGFHFSGFNGV